MKFDPQSFKHSKTQEDIKFLYASYLTEWFSNDDRGNVRAMLVGFDQNGNLMEAAFELIASKYEDDEEYFYHAMVATPEWQKQYEKRRRHR